MTSEVHSHVILSGTWAFGPPIVMKDAAIHVTLSGAKDLASSCTLQEQRKILRSAQDDMWWRSDLSNDGAHQRIVLWFFPIDWIEERFFATLRMTRVKVGRRRMVRIHATVSAHAE